MQDLIPHLWYETVYLVTHCAFTLGWSMRTEGGKHVPKTGPVLLLANHTSFFDPMLVGISTRRHLSYLARKTLFRNPLFASFIRSVNAVPIDQEGVGKEGLKTIIGQLQQGRAVVVFPEGTRTEDGEMIPFKPGVHLMITRVRSTIVPVGIAGAYHAWPVWRAYPNPAPLFLPPSRGNIAVSIGEPFDSQQYEGMAREKVLADLFQKVKTVKDRAEKLRRKN